MKTFLLSLSVLLIFFSCEKDCILVSGKMVNKEIELATFSQIVVGTGVQLCIKDSITQKVVVQADEKRIESISFLITDDLLEIMAKDICMMNSSLDPIKVFINSPNLYRIRNASEYTITSANKLDYSFLSLLVDDIENDYLNIGNFDLDIHCNSLEIISNGMGNIKLSGDTNNLSLGYYNGIGRFDGANIVAENIKVFHRGENDIIVNTQGTLFGHLYSVGNLISVATPEWVNIEEHYLGKLIYE